MSRRVLRALRRPFQSAEAVRRVLLSGLAEPESRLSADAGRYWSDSSDDAHIRDQSHWRGEGRWADADWLAIGEAHLAMYRALCAAAGRNAEAPSLLEWGPGGGANLVAFAPFARTLYGADISRPNLIECARQVSAAGHADFRAVEFAADSPEDVLSAVREPVDVVLSTAVFQHFPSKRYGRRVLDVMQQLLAPAGVAIVQIRYDDGDRRYSPKQRDYRHNVRTFTSYGIAEFWNAVIDAGLTPLSVRLVPRTHYAYFFMTKDGT